MTAREKLTSAEPAPGTPRPPGETGQEIGWLPDCVYTGGVFESGLAFFADRTGRITRFSREPADLARAKRLAGQAALPGLVNTHVQSWERVMRGRLDVTARAGRGAGGDAAERSDSVIDRLDADELYDAARLAFLEMMLSGVTCVGEAYYLHRGPAGAAWAEPHLGARAILRAAHDVGVRICLLNGAWMRAGFGQPVGLAPARAVSATAEEFIQDCEALRAYIEHNLPGDETWLGVAVRGLDAVPLAALQSIAGYAHAKRLRLHVGLGASPGEPEACAAEYGRPSAVLLGERGLLDKRFVAVHAAQLTDDDVRALGSARVTVCACPASEAPSRGAPIRADRLLGAGALLALGTDGPVPATLFDQARVLEFQLRGAEPGATAAGGLTTVLWQAATSAGARSLGAPGGALEVGRPADFFTVNLFDPALLGAAPEHLPAIVLAGAGPRAVREVWVGARQRVTQWRHPAQSAIISRFAELQRRLWPA